MPLTVCLFDLDDFKQINDRYGHPAGDRVLAHVAARLRPLGEAYRLGGDEFAVVFPRRAGRRPPRPRPRRSSARSARRGGSRAGRSA